MCGNLRASLDAAREGCRPVPEGFASLNGDARGAAVIAPGFSLADENVLQVPVLQAGRRSGCHRRFGYHLPHTKNYSYRKQFPLPHANPHTKNYSFSGYRIRTSISRLAKGAMVWRASGSGGRKRCVFT